MPKKVVRRKNRRKNDFSSTEFLIKTLASVQSALTNIDNESSAKTESLSAIAENISSIAEMMKNFHEQNIRDASKIIDLDGDIKSLRNDLKLLDNDSDIKEIKFAIQKAEANLAELKTIKQVKEDMENNKPNKKWGMPSSWADFFDGLKNIKTILMVILIIILFVSSLFYGPSVIQVFIDLIKKMLV